MDKNNKPFLFTMDKKVAEKLQKQNFTLLSSNSNGYVFVNDRPLCFSNDEDMISKIIYTNKLMF